MEFQELIKTKINLLHLIQCERRKRIWDTAISRHTILSCFFLFFIFCFQMVSILFLFFSIFFIVIKIFHLIPCSPSRSFLVNDDDELKIANRLFDVHRLLNSWICELVCFLLAHGCRFSD